MTSHIGNTEELDARVREWDRNYYSTNLLTQGVQSYVTVSVKSRISDKDCYFVMYLNNKGVVTLIINGWLERNENMVT